MSAADIVYRELVSEIIQIGEVHENRTGVNTRRIWGHMAKFDLNSGFPLLTQKKIAVRSAFVELLGFVRGETDVDWYERRGCKIWSADHARWHGKDLDRDISRLEILKVEAKDVYDDARNTEARQLIDSIAFRQAYPRSLGRIYGAQWRDFGCIDPDSDMGSILGNGYDQLAEIIKALKAGSNSRRLIMSAWAPDELHMMALPPCHIAYHFVKRFDYVDVAMWQRSCDTALGVPFNWATTALLTHLVANAAGLKPGRMTWFGDDVHIYEPHVKGFDTQFGQTAYAAPHLEITAPGKMPWEIEYEDINLINYRHSDAVKFELFVG